MAKSIDVLVSSKSGLPLVELYRSWREPGGREVVALYMPTGDGTTELRVYRAQPTEGGTDQMARNYELTGRHTATRAIMRWFQTGHLAPTNKEIVQEVEDLALIMIGKLPDDPELVVGLRHLLDAKDAFVRANVARLEGGWDG